ncbi:MAG TPA: PAS domain-containing sensor histidine kinase [Kofleriaceae bacterium]|jgi:PAS domain S-box-containing protein
MPTLPTPAEYRLLIEHSPVMIWRAGLDAKCDYFNDTWLAFTGRTLEQEVGDGWAEGVHPDDLQRCVDHYLTHFQRREAFEMEYRIRRHDGVFRWIFDRGVPYTNDRGEFAGYIGSCVDVDERRRAQEEREQADRQQLALAHEFESWILAIVGHDIRNPLGAIDTSAKILAMRAAPEMHHIVERIERSAARITSIVADLLDVSRDRHAGGIPVVLSETDLHALCREVADEIGVFATDRTITVACAGNAMGRWDGNRIAQAISNLVGNAVKHGTPDKPIEVRVHGDNGNAIVEVHNEGVISPQIMPTLFQPFASRGDRQRHRDGLGLGLFIARSIARAHRGQLDVDSSPDTGTTFRMTLPRAS